MKTRKAPRGKPFSPGYDERRNLLGAPKRGDSYAEQIDKTSQLTPADIVQLVGRNNDLGKFYAQMPQDVPIKTLMILRNFAAEMFEPSAGRLNVLMERTEGKVTEKHEVKQDGKLEIIVRKASDETGHSDK